MILEDLLNIKKITIEDYELYNLFHLHEPGRKYLDRAMFHSFMEEPTQEECRAGKGIPFYDGRRSVVRDIHRVIAKINYLIKEHENDTAR